MAVHYQQATIIAAITTAASTTTKSENQKENDDNDNSTIGEIKYHIFIHIHSHAGNWLFSLHRPWKISLSFLASFVSAGIYIPAISN